MSTDETEVTTLTRTAGELRAEIRQLQGERADADVRRACQMFGAEEEIEDLDRRIGAAETEARELEYRAQVLANEAAAERTRLDREEKARIDEAIRYTGRLRREFREALGAAGWYLQPSAEGRLRIERSVLAGIAAAHGQGAADFCRTRILPAQATSGSAGGTAGAPAPVEDEAGVLS